MVPRNTVRWLCCANGIFSSCLFLVTIKRVLLPWRFFCFYFWFTLKTPTYIQYLFKTDACVWGHSRTVMYSSLTRNYQHVYPPPPPPPSRPTFSAELSCSQRQMVDRTVDLRTVDLRTVDLRTVDLRTVDQRTVDQRMNAPRTMGSAAVSTGPVQPAASPGPNATSTTTTIPSASPKGSRPYGRGGKHMSGI